MYGRRYTRLMSSAIYGNVPWRVYVIKPENKWSQRLEVKKVSDCSSWCFRCFRVSEGHGKNQKQLLIVCQFRLGRVRESCRTIFGTVLPELGTWRLPTRNQLGLVQVWILSRSIEEVLIGFYQKNKQEKSRYSHIPVQRIQPKQLPLEDWPTWCNSSRDNRCAS